jgi:hypothetical protein
MAVAMPFLNSGTLKARMRVENRLTRRSGRDEPSPATLAMPVRSRSPALRTDQRLCPSVQLSKASALLFPAVMPTPVPR